VIVAEKFNGHWNRLQDWVYDFSVSASILRRHRLFRMSIALKYGSVEMKAKRVFRTAKKPQRNEASRNKGLTVRSAVHFRCHPEGGESRDGPVWEIRRFQAQGGSVAESLPERLARKNQKPRCRGQRRWHHSIPSAVCRLNDTAAATALLKRVQQAFVAGDAHDSLAAAHSFFRVRQNPVAAAARYDLPGVLFCIVDDRVGFHIRSFPACIGYGLRP
jgi:hypothetical protein